MVHHRTLFTAEITETAETKIGLVSEETLCGLCDLCGEYVIEAR